MCYPSGRKRCCAYQERCQALCQNFFSTLQKIKCPYFIPDGLKMVLLYLCQAFHQRLLPCEIRLNSRWLIKYVPGCFRLPPCSCNGFESRTECPWVSHKVLCTLIKCTLWLWGQGYWQLESSGMTRRPCLLSHRTGS